MTMPEYRPRPDTRRTETVRDEPAPVAAADACPVCSRAMVRSSGGKWLCKTCGFLLTCCDPD
jgi:ribosomal protein L37AE/L43A